MISPPTISTRPWKRPRQTIPSTCRSMRHGSCDGRASSRSRDQGRISAGASGRISAMGWATTRYFPAFDQTKRVGLLYRDLLGAALAGMWSVDALIAEIGDPPAASHCRFAAAGRSCLPRRPAPRMAASGTAYGGLTAEDIETLANDPPLPFFILFEAMQQPQAEGLQPRAARLDHRIGSDIRRARRATRDRPAAARSPKNCRSHLREYYLTNVFRKYPKSQAWTNWWNSPPRSPICGRPCPHFCEAELFRLTQPGGVNNGASKECK